MFVEYAILAYFYNYDIITNVAVILNSQTAKNTYIKREVNKMKKIMKIAFAAVMAIVMAFAATACSGLDKSKVKGDWTLFSINGKEIATYADEVGIDVKELELNWTVNDDNVTATNAQGTASFKIEFKSNGFEVLDAEGKVAMSVKYDSANETLSYAAKAGENQFDYVMKNGTATIGDTTNPAE